MKILVKPKLTKEDLQEVLNEKELVYSYESASGSSHLSYCGSVA